MDAAKDINDIRDRYLIVIEQVDQSVHNNELRMYAADELEQSVGDGNIELVTCVRTGDKCPVQKRVRIDLFHPRKPCK